MAKAAPAAALAGWLRTYPLAPRYRRARRLRLTAADGVRLSAVALDGPPDARATVVLVHGFLNSSRSPRMHAFALRLARHVHVLVPDLRGHGRSRGACTLGLHEPLDVAAAVAAAPAALPVVTVGVSLGGSAAMLAAGQHRGVVGVISVSAPAWSGSRERKGSDRLHRLVASRLGRATAAAFLGTRIASSPTPVPDARATVAAIAPAFSIVVHDPHDHYFGPDHAQSLHSWAGPPKDLWWYPGGGHGIDLLTPALAERILGRIGSSVSPLAAGGLLPALSGRPPGPWR